jgi:MFS family permease
MGLLLGSPLIGAGVGGIFSGWLSDKVGRVKAMVLTLCWFSLFTLLFPFGQNYWQLFALRVLAGLGLGAQWGVGGTLIAEMVPTKFRFTCIFDWEIV